MVGAVLSAPPLFQKRLQAVQNHSRRHRGPDCQRHPGKRLRASEPSGEYYQEAAAWLARTGLFEKRTYHELLAFCASLYIIALNAWEPLIAPDHVQPRSDVDL
jgi:hypothetical protein